MLTWLNSLSLDTLTRIYDKLQWFIAVFGLLTGLALVLSWYTNARIAALRNAREEALSTQVNALASKQVPRQLTADQQAEIIRRLSLANVQGAKVRITTTRRWRFRMQRA